MATKLFGGLSSAAVLFGVVVACAAAEIQSGPFEASLASFNIHMQRAAEAANHADAEGTVSEFRLACEQLHSAKATAPQDDAPLVRAMAKQCNVVLAEFAMGDMESAIAILKDLAWMASRLGPIDDEPEVNPYWMRCALKFTLVHRDKCNPECSPEHYGSLLNDVADHCGGSDIQPSGGYLLRRIWVEATNRLGKTKGKTE